MEPVLHGPTGFPELTLGWHIMSWQFDNLFQPDGTNAGDRWMLTDEQFRFVAWWYAVDETGRWVYRRGVLRRMKGHGKDPLLASLALTELVGPCRFDRLASAEEAAALNIPDGQPIGCPQNSAWIQVAATSISQTQNTMSVFPGMISPEMKAKYGFDIGKEKIYAGGGRLEAVTSSPRALEGSRPTFVIMNETAHWLPNNEGHSMAQVITRNLAKSAAGTSRALAITNSHYPGEDSVAERDWDAYEAVRDGRSKAKGFLYDSREAPAGIDLADTDQLRDGLKVARGDSTWLDIDRLIDEIHDPTTPPSMSRAYYLNQITAAEDSWISASEWDRCKTDDALQPGDYVCLGFDGSIRDDSTALAACRLSDGLVVLLGVWEKPDGPAGDEWQVDREAVHGLVDEIMQKYKVIGFYADPAHWQDAVDAWQQKYGHRLVQPAVHGKPVEWWTHRPLAMIHALQRFHEAVLMQELIHDGGQVLRRHILNAKNRVNPLGITIAKEHPQSKRKIDAAMAATLAFECRGDAIRNRLQDRFLRRRRRATGF